MLKLRSLLTNKRRIVVPVVIVTTMFLVAYLGVHARRVLGVHSTQGKMDQKADCAVVLTGGPGRIREGFSLLSQHQVRKLIISGVHPLATIREVFPQLPFYGSADERDVILEKRSTTTYGNVIQSLAILDALRCRSVLVVTSALHTYRSLRTFQAHSPEAIQVEARSIDQWPEPSMLDKALEVVKSSFYGIWAY